MRASLPSRLPLRQGRPDFSSPAMQQAQPGTMNQPAGPRAW